MSEKAEETALTHATKHFEIHAAQRLTAFNFFIVISGAILAAMAASLQKPDVLAIPGTALGILLVVLSAIFWKLDRRTKFLIKHSESAIKHFERNNLPSEFRVFCNEELETEAHREENKNLTRMFSYSEVFGLLFAGSGLLGMAGAITLTLSPEILSSRSERTPKDSEVAQPVAIELEKTARPVGPEPEMPVDLGASVRPKMQISKDVDLAEGHQQSGS